MVQTKLIRILQLCLLLSLILQLSALRLVLPIISWSSRVFSIRVEVHQPLNWLSISSYATSLPLSISSILQFNRQILGRIRRGKTHVHLQLSSWSCSSSHPRQQESKLQVQEHQHPHHPHSPLFFSN